MKKKYSAFKSLLWKPARDFYWSLNSIDLDLFSKFLLKAFLPSKDRINNVCLNALEQTCVSDLLHHKHQNIQDSRGKSSEEHICIKGWLESVNFLIKSVLEKASGRHRGIQIPLQLYLYMNKDRRVFHEEKWYVRIFYY